MHTKLAVNGRWQLLRPLGEGADAVAWLAVDQRDGARVALKALRRLDAPAARDRFRLEFAALAEIDHPNLIRVFDLGVADGPGPLAPGQLFFTAELLDAERPANRLAALDLPARAAALCQLIAEVAAALDTLHRRGLIHHDVKPDNLLVDGAGRVRLGDLGLAAARGAAGDVRGTLAYLAPEALSGARGTDKLDLYALGATAWELWGGRPLFAASTIGELWQAQQGPPPPKLAGAPESLANLVAHLLNADPAQRPSSARAVAQEAIRLGARFDGLPVEPESHPPPARPALVGRRRQLATLLQSLSTAQLVVVEGLAGSGRSRLIEEARRATQLAAASQPLPAPVWHGTSLAAAARTLGVAPPRGEERAAQLWLGALCERLSASACIVHLDLGDSVGSLEREFLNLAAHGAAAPSVVVAELPLGVLPGETANGTISRILVEPLLRPDVRALVDSMMGRPSPALAAAIFSASGGEPLRCVELVRAAAVRSTNPGPSDVAALDASDLSALLTPVVERLPPDARSLLEALSVLGRASTPTELASLLDLAPARAFRAIATLTVAGLAAESDGRLRFPSRAHARAAATMLPSARGRALHRQALQQLAGDPDDRARHLIVLGPNAEAAAAALEASVPARRRLDLDWADELLRAALRLGRGLTARQARLGLASLLTSRADYDGALAALQPLDEDPAACLARARALQRAGRSDEAEAPLRRLLDSLDDAKDANEVNEAKALLAWVLNGQGRNAEALDVCAGVGSPSAAEARGLACLYLGRLDEAEVAFADVARSTADDGVALARARSLAGMVAQAHDDLPRATAAYGEALRLARQDGDLHGAAIYAANLGGTLREQGEYARALAPSAEAARDLGRLGKRSERSGALFNHGNLLLSMGDLAGADQAAIEASELAAGAARETAFATMLSADVARRRGQPEVALRSYQEAQSLATGAGPHVQAVAALNVAEALAEAGRADEARRALAQSSPLAEAANLGDTWLLARARVELLVGDPVATAMLEQTWARATRTGRRDLQFRAALTLARAHVRLSAAATALEWLQRAQNSWEEIRMRTPEMQREALDTDPDARRLRQLLSTTEPAVPSATRSVILAAPDAVRRLLGINKRLNSELRLPRLLELILDTVIDLTSAERGFILLADDAGHLQVSQARNMDEKALEADKSGFSRSIAERAAREGVPIVTVDAAGDERFGAAMSVSDLKLRSVLAVPLAVKGQVVGCIYVDHRLRSGAFGEADVQLVCDLAEQAAIAIDNARLLADNEAKTQRVTQLARELEHKVASQAIELSELHKEVRTSRAALTVRYNYDNLVGRTHRMLELFRLLDRVTETALPVVIYGESGTGKELVARAIHHNGPRRDRPFVTESCAAIPETLLEAALFGHVRGAFTGADAERRGLFEVAHGGTLFRDEVGEMSPAMQAKLLRVLQSGEFRRLGGERTLKVDVRLLVASNRDLSRMVEAGTFREDLFYRLNVVRVALPPLRERRDDIPLLVEHFLGKHAKASGRRPPRLQRAALQKLVGYRWPGNVRELENEILRSAALGGELITVEDLSPQVAAGDPEAAFDSPDDLGLKKRVERLERTLLREALERSGGNQTQAARLLGLSRFGLQKKLRRYGLEA